MRRCARRPARHFDLVETPLVDSINHLCQPPVRARTDFLYPDPSVQAVAGTPRSGHLACICSARAACSRCACTETASPNLRTEDNLANTKAVNYDRAATEELRQDAALRLLDRDGVLSGLNLREVADEAGVNRGLVYHYFGSRAALQRRALRKTARERIGAISVARDMPFRERVLHYWRTVHAISARDPTDNLATAGFQQRDTWRERTG